MSAVSKTADDKYVIVNNQNGTLYLYIYKIENMCHKSWITENTKPIKNIFLNNPYNV